MFSKHREEVGLFDTPQKSRERNPPFSIEIDFTQYRRGRDYTVSILTENYFDAFIMQVGDRCQTQICNQEGVVTTRSNTCSLLTFSTAGPWTGETGWERDSCGGVGQDAGDHEAPQVYRHDALNVSFSSESRLEN